MSDQENELVPQQSAEEIVANDAENNGEDFDMSLKKKKKKSKKEKKDKKDDESDKEAPSAGADGEGDDMFSDMKKKKKKSKKEKKEKAESDGEGDADSAQEEGEDFDFGEKKKKKKKKRPDVSEFEEKMRDEEGRAGSGDEGGDSLQDSVESLPKSETKEPHIPQRRFEGELYPYHELLERVFKILRSNNPELGGEKKRYTIAPPQVLREGSKKTVFANLVDICRRMHRQPDHVIQYIFAELGTTGSVDGNQRLVIRGRFQQKQMENVLKRYITEYVTCKTCKSPDTTLTKENKLYFLHCESCGSSRTVSAIKTGFQAQTTKRSIQRAQA